jgi:hypothetical protein
MRRTAKTTGLLVTSAAAGLATLSQCSAGLFDGLFKQNASKDPIEKRLPASDCSFGYFSTSWQPWGTCDEGRNAGCASDGYRTAPRSVLPGFQPGYSSRSPAGDLLPYEEVCSSSGSVLPPGHPGTFQARPGSGDNSRTPILMAPQHARPGVGSTGTPTDPFEPELVNPFPRAIRSNPELLAPEPNPYPVPQPNSGLLIAPEPQPGSAIELPSTPYRGPLDLPTIPPGTPRPTVPGANGSSGTGINLPPRRSTSVTIDIPSGSAGSTLSLPDPVRSGTFGDSTSSRGLSSPGLSSPRQPATGLPSKPGEILPNFDIALPAVTPGSPATAPVPSLRLRPPLPVPSTLPRSAAAYRYPIQQPVTQYPAVQHPRVQPADSQYPVTR